MQKIEFIAPVEAMRGNLSGKQVLEYAENNNPAFEAPAGRQYAKNYQPRFIGAKRASSGLKYFAVKTKSATLINSGSKLTMALLGGAGAILAGVAHNAVLRARCEATFELAKKAGQTSARTYRKFMTDILIAQLSDKNPIISLAVSDGEESSSFAIQNPWCYNEQHGGIRVEVSNSVLVKFWNELALNPIIFTIDGRKGVAHGGEDADTFATIVASRYNVLGLSIAQGEGAQPVMLGEDHVCFEVEGVLYNAMSTGKKATEQADPGMVTNKFVLSDQPGQTWDD